MITRFLLSGLLLWPTAFATIRCVGSTPALVTCGTTATATATHVQDAITAAVAGDFVYIQPGIYAGTFEFKTNGDPLNPITVISQKYDWLPCAYCRISPSHLPNVPIFSINAANIPALAGNKDGSSNPPVGWKFIGIAFQQGRTGDHAGSILHTGGQGVYNWYPADSSHVPDSIVFDRTLILPRFTDDYTVYNGAVLNGSNIVFKNSFVWPIYGGGTEVKGLGALTGPGPLTLSNNFISAMSIPVLTGGDAPDYVGGIPANMTITDNFVYRPWKWYPDKWDAVNYCATIGVGGCYATANPFPAYFLNNLPNPTYGCVKNLGEHKAINGFAIWERNVHENNWVDGGGRCLGQWFGITLTMRQTGWPSPAFAGPDAYSNMFWMDSTYTPPGGCDTSTRSNGHGGFFTPYASGSGCVGSLSTSGTAFTWQGQMNVTYPTSRWIRAGNSLCTINYSQSLDVTFSWHWVYDCRLVSSITSYDVTGATPSVGVLASAFSTDITHPSTTTTSSMDATQITIPVASTTNFNAFDFVKVEHEWMIICSVGSGVLNVCPNTFLRDYSGNAVTGRGWLTNVSYPERAATTHASGSSVSKVNLWAWIQDAEGAMENVTIQNSIFRNVAGGINILAKDRYGWPAANNGTTLARVSNFKLRNILYQDTVPGFGHDIAWKLYNQEELQVNESGVSGNDILIENLTYDWWRESGQLVQFVGDGIPDSLHAKVTNLTFRNSIMPDSYDFGGGTHFATSMTGSSTYYNNWTHGADFIAGTQYFGYNQFAFVSTTCSGVTCPGNRATALASTTTYNPGTFKLRSDSPLAKAGHNGSDMGANPDLLPQIRNLRVATSSQTALLEFDLSGPIRDAGNTQPCMLEVSTSETLHSYIGSAGAYTLPYTTIAALNPAYFKQPDQSTTTNSLLLSPVVSGGHVSWPIGQNATVTGDDTVSHSLALTPSTTYYGRLMCYGDTSHFTFTTTAATSGRTTLPFRVTNATAPYFQVDYGPTAALGGISGISFSAGVASRNVSVTAGQHVYTRISYLSGPGGSVIWTGPLELRLP